MNDVKFWLSWGTAGDRKQIENFMSLTSDRAADVWKPVPVSFIHLNPLKNMEFDTFSSYCHYYSYPLFTFSQFSMK